MAAAKVTLSLFVKGLRELAKEGDEWATGVLRQIGAAGSKTVKTQGTAREVGRGTPGTIIKKDPKAPGGSRMARGKKTALKKKLKNEQRALTRSGALKVGGTAAAGAAVPLADRKIKERRKAAAEKERKAKAEAERKATAKRRGASTAAARAAAREGARKTEPKRKRRLILGKDAKIRPLGGVIARALFGKDEDFGNEKGLLDFGPRKKPKGKKMGGEVKKYRDGGLSRAQKSLLRGAQQHRAQKGATSSDNWATLDALTAKHGDLYGQSQRRRSRPKPPPSAPGMRGSGMGPGMKNGGMAKKQGANARLDESLGERRGKESTKSQSMKSRRNESRGARKPSRPKSAGAAKRGWGAAIR